MSTTVKPIPDGYSAVTPYLTIQGAVDAIAFYKKAFGAEEVMVMKMPDGKVMHAEISIGGAHIMLHDENKDWGTFGPLTVGGSSSAIMLYVPDVDAMFNAAVEAGAKVTMAVADQFYGDRCGNIVDPFGHKWCLATHIEDVTEEEVVRRAAKMFEQPPA